MVCLEDREWTFGVVRSRSLGGIKEQFPTVIGFKKRIEHTRFRDFWRLWRDWRCIQ